MSCRAFAEFDGAIAIPDMTGFPFGRFAAPDDVLDRAAVSLTYLLRLGTASARWLARAGREHLDLYLRAMALALVCADLGQPSDASINRRCSLARVPGFAMSWAKSSADCGREGWDGRTQKELSDKKK